MQQQTSDLSPLGPIFNHTSSRKSMSVSIPGPAPWGDSWPKHRLCVLRGCGCRSHKVIHRYGDAELHGNYLLILLRGAVCPIVYNDITCTVYCYCAFNLFRSQLVSLSSDSDGYCLMFYLHSSNLTMEKNAIVNVTCIFPSNCLIISLFRPFFAAM